MTAQILTPAGSLAVRCAGRTQRFEPGCSAVLLRGGELRILDRHKQISAVYRAGTWTIVMGAAGTPLGHPPGVDAAQRRAECALVV
ncbi:MAG TPA: hypothetical protein VIW24_03825, partial [Aldersonia sp.]